jgi:hypothetical protein
MSTSDIRPIVDLASPAEEKKRKYEGEDKNLDAVPEVSKNSQ